MKKYHRIFIIPAIVIIIAGIFSGFSEQSCTETAENLLKERTKILQQAYYGRIEIDKAEKYLGRIETYPLLSEDISYLRSSESTELDIVKTMEFLDIKQENKSFHYVSIKAKIRWYMSGLESEYVSDNEYSVILKEDGNEYKLSEFTAFPLNY